MKSSKDLNKPEKVFFAFIIGISIILFWRGIWGLADEFLFPSNLIFSYISSVIIGLIFLVVTGYFVKRFIY